jgi:PTS system galactitol-specific IIC component
VEIGWPPLSAITWGSPIAPFVIPLTMLINVIMIAIKQTRTVDVDMWNYWHFAEDTTCLDIVNYFNAK